MTNVLAITVAYAAPGVEAIVPLALPVGSTVAHAVAASGLRERFALDDATTGYAIHGQRADGDTPLADGDRVELTRPLIADAKQTRRARAAGKPIPKGQLRKKRQ
jgi:putative ubiquitin-RnfH superfamily antitoxin RatB of RatAB toxin-antitoxin module